MSLLPEVNMHFHLTLYYIHAVSKFHFTLHLNAKNILTAHSATAGRHSHFVSVVVQRRTEPVSALQRSWQWQSEEPQREILQLMGRRVLPECFGQGTEMTATPLHSLTLSALHWLATWARLIRSHLWQGSTRSCTFSLNCSQALLLNL